MKVRQALTPAQRARLRERLEAEHRILRQQAAAHMAAAGKAGVAERIETSHWFTEILVYQANLFEQGSWLYKANRLERALADFQAGAYGRCDECGLALGYETLSSMPDRRYCDVCEQGKQRIRN